MSIEKRWEAGGSGGEMDIYISIKHILQPEERQPILSLYVSKQKTKSIYALCTS